MVSTLLFVVIMTLVSLFYLSLAGAKRLNDVLFGLELPEDKLMRKKAKTADVRKVGLTADKQIDRLKKEVALFPVVLNQ